MSSNSDQTSGLRFYSYGIVIEDSIDDSDYIKVVPIEDLPLASGKLNEATFDYKVKGTDHKGVSVTGDIKGVAFVVARWAALENGNRNTSPNVYESETVMLLKYASTNDVYWCDLFREPKLRRLENVVYSFSNLKEKGAAYDQESSYWFQVSTRDKVIRLHTCNNDGEPVEFDFTVDTDKGTFSISDSNKNQIFLDSVNGDLKVDMMNSIELNAPQIRINGKEYVRTTGNEIKDTADSTITQTSGGTFTMDSGGTVDILKPTTVIGTVVSTGDVVAAGISVDEHTHLYNPGGGGPTPSSPPA